MRFSEKLAKIRKNNNLSQEQLADKLGVSRQAISKWESGSSYPDMERMIELCTILNCNLEDLMDDGVIGISSKTEQKNNFKNFFDDFLSYITKTYNMFWSMTFKEKIKCLIEMGVLIAILVILSAMVYSIIDSLFYPFLDNRFTFVIYHVLSSVLIIGLFVVCSIIFFHIFKIRYLDYFVTVTDAQATKKTIEEPIKEPNEYIEKPRERVIIRDPIHATSTFMDVISSIFIALLKGLIVIFSVPFVIGIFLGSFAIALLIYHTIYGVIFLYIALAILGAILICYVEIDFAYKFLFNCKIGFKKNFIVAFIGVVLMGISSGAAATCLTSFDFVDKDKSLKKTVEYIDMKDNLIFSDNYHTEYIVDESIDNIKVEISTDLNGNYRINTHDYHSNELDKTYRLYDIYLVNNPSLMYKTVMKDIKNKQIKEYYNDINVKIYLNSENYNKIAKNYEELYYQY